MNTGQGVGGAPVAGQNIGGANQPGQGAGGAGGAGQAGHGAGGPGGVGPGQAPVQGQGQGGAPAGGAQGQAGARRVAPHQAAPQLGNLNPPHQVGKPIGQREAKKTEVEKTIGLRKDDDLKKMNQGELAKAQDEEFDKLHKLTERFEQHSILGKALEALTQGNNGDKADKLEVTITLPGETTPIKLIPMDLNVPEARRTVLVEQAIAILQRHQDKAFPDFNPDTANNLFDTLKANIRNVAERLGDKDKEEGEHKWEIRWKTVRERPTTVVAYGNRDNLDEAEVVAKPIKPQGQQQNPNGNGNNN